VNGANPFTRLLLSNATRFAMTHTKNDEKNTISSSRIHNLLSLLIRSQQLLDPTLAPVRVHLSAPAQNKSIVIQIQKQTWTVSDQTKARKPRSPHYARCLLSCGSPDIPSHGRGTNKSATYYKSSHRISKFHAIEWTPAP